MAKKKEVPDVIDQGRAAHGINTATGYEEAYRSGDAEIPKGKDRGAKEDLSDGAKADFLKPQKPIGLQDEPAEFVTNGSLEPNMVPSTSGPIPASAANFTSEAGEDAVDKAKADRDQALADKFAQRDEIPEETISRMSAAELRAVATDRGYDDVWDTMGRKQARSAFLKAQKADKTVKRGKK